MVGSAVVKIVESREARSSTIVRPIKTNITLFVPESRGVVAATVSGITTRVYRDQFWCQPNHGRGLYDGGHGSGAEPGRAAGAEEGRDPGLDSASGAGVVPRARLRRCERARDRRQGGRLPDHRLRALPPEGGTSLLRGRRAARETRCRRARATGRPFDLGSAEDLLPL